MYEWQKEQGTKDIEEALAARGLQTSGYGVGHLGEFYTELNAREMEKKKDLLRMMAGFQPQTPSYSGSSLPAELSMQYGANIGNTMMQGSNAKANALLAGGQARSGMWTNMANLGMAGLNSYAQYQGMQDLSQSLNNFYSMYT
jgi:hypothetical protein